MTINKTTLLLLVVTLFSLLGCAAKPPKFLDADHPLSNTIWDVKQQRFVSQSEVASVLLDARYIVLGESHDNPLHHELQNWALNVLIDANKQPGVAFEMLDNTQVEKLTATPPPTTDALFDTVNWDKSGWPERKLYQAIFQTVIDAKLPIYSANLPREALREVISQKKAPSAEVQQLLDALPLSEEDTQSMLKELEDSHCNMLPERYTAGMITGQRVRDAIMALSLLNHGDATPAVLIAGKAHGRLDRGAPAFVKQQQPEARLISIGWHEVQADIAKPEQYAEIWQSSSLPFDYVWFTPRLDRPDPCDEIKRFIKKQKE